MTLYSRNEVLDYAQTLAKIENAVRVYLVEGVDCVSLLDDVIYFLGLDND